MKEGNLTYFDHLQGFLGGSDQPSVPALAQELGISESALKSSIHRLRQRYRNLLRDEVAATVDQPGEVDEELRFLVRAISTHTAEV